MNARIRDARHTEKYLRSARFGTGRRCPSLVAAFVCFLAVVDRSTCRAQAAGGVTWTTSTLPIGTNPISVAVADFNADGNSDIIVGTATSVGLLKGNGDGTFKALSALGSTSNTQSLAIDAFRTAGAKDIIAIGSAASPTNNVTYLPGNGSGGVSALEFFSLPYGSASSIATGDFNGDGKQDFVVSLQNGIAFFLGKGDGTFNAPTILPMAGGPPPFVAVGNFNGHGDKDFAVANSSGNTVTIFLNDGNGNFSLGPDVTVGNGPNSIAVGDFDGDGIDDLAVVNHTDNTVSVRLGVGHGTFKIGSTVATGGGAFSIVPGDFNSDGHVDLAVTNELDNTVTVLLGNGDGTFTADPVVKTGSSPTYVAVGNFNGKGNVDLVVTNSGDHTVSVLLSQAGQSPPPVFTVSPTSQTLGQGSDVSFSFTATGSNVTYQWQKNGLAITGQTAATLTLTNIQMADAGSYTVVATNSAGQATSAAATLTVAAPLPGRIVNMSVRSQAGTGAQTLIAGFVIAGTSPKPLLIRGSGPTLANFGVPNTVTDPSIYLFSGPTPVTNNDDWGTAPNQAGIIAANGNMEGIYPLNVKDSIILSSLPISSAGYTTQLIPVDNTPGVALIELFDTDTGTPGTPEYAAQSRLINISARSQVGTGANILIAGFVINGNMSKRLMIRGSGPTLTNFGVTGVLADPFLTLYNLNTKIAENDSWSAAPNVSAIMAGNGQMEGAYTLDPKDCIIWITLPPGIYTAQVSGVNNTTGVGLVEVFDLP